MSLFKMGFAARRSAIAALLLLTGATSAMAQATQPEPKSLAAGESADEMGARKPAKPADPSTFPRLANGKPDFTGIWNAGVKGLVNFEDTDLDIPFTPDYMAVHQQRVKAINDGNPPSDYVSTCQAFGMPRVMSFYTIELVVRPEQMWAITEIMHEVRRIYLDGKPHGEFQLKSFNGVSVGHWEGDELVIETTKLKAGYMSMFGMPHSDQMRITERIRMVNRDAIENTMTITDPVALTKPWTVLQRYDRRPADYEISEYNCLENNLSGGGVSVPPESDPGKMLPKSAFSEDQDEGASK